MIRPSRGVGIVSPDGIYYSLLKRYSHWPSLTEIRFWPLPRLYDFLFKYICTCIRAEEWIWNCNPPPLPQQPPPPNNPLSPPTPTPTSTPQAQDLQFIQINILLKIHFKKPRRYTYTNEIENLNAPLPLYQYFQNFLSIVCAFVII